MKNILCNFFLIFLLINTSVLANEEFIINSIDKAIEISQTTNQPILLIFGSNNCTFCEQLKKDLINTDLSETLDKYIICYIDIDKNIKLKNEYVVKTIPDTRIIKNKIQIAKIIGYNSNTYLEKIKNVK